MFFKVMTFVGLFALSVTSAFADSGNPKKRTEGGGGDPVAFKVAVLAKYAPLRDLGFSESGISQFQETFQNTQVVIVDNRMEPVRPVTFLNERDLDKVLSQIILTRYKSIKGEVKAEVLVSHDAEKRLDKLKSEKAFQDQLTKLGVNPNAVDSTDMLAAAVTRSYSGLIREATDATFWAVLKYRVSQKTASQSQSGSSDAGAAL